MISCRPVAILALIVVLVASCKSKEPAPVNLTAANKVAIRSVNLFFESPEMLLTPEPRQVALPENEAAALAPLVRELLRGPARPTAFRSFPQDVILRGAFLLPDGTAVIDLGGATLTNGWNTSSHEELMAVFSLVQTLTSNLGLVKVVRILINGQTAETLAGHVAIDRRLRPIPWMLAPSSAG